MKSATSALFLLAVLALPQSTLGFIPTTYTNDNIFTAEQDKPVSLFFDGQGGFYGFTEQGFRYSQVPVYNNFGIRLHKFSIDQAYFYMSDKGMIAAESDLTAISIYFARTS